MQEENKELVIGGTLQQQISPCLDTLEVFLLQDRPVVSSMVVCAEKTKVDGSMNISETVAHIMGIQGKIHNTNKISEDFDVLIRKMKDADFVPDILIELVTKKEVDRSNIFLLPGIEGCSSVYKSIASGIKSSATCLQHSVLNIPDESHSVTKLAAYLLPHLLKRMKDQREFLIVGYSFGSLIAIELARLLEANDFSRRLILIDETSDQMKILVNQYFHCASLEELRNTVLLGLLGMYVTINKEAFALELNKCNTVDEKLKIFHAYFPNDVNVLTTKIKN
ncbi:Uncharacterized protein DBV15_11484 [Temnothorax longispinosus]|uniref:oleoyl-[acyl-carrier-protein] hydrolase n=1 Tax=Temnothorax longispinosus TaxID=300112 RepID=A0A4S2L2K4_9HYME|nr:Uncharacterized protein DBV15_11484 [Temnothorax longispinosus]